MRAGNLPARAVLIVALASALLAACSGSDSSTSTGGSPPPRNPFLADSDYSIGHGDSAQQDASPVLGPGGPTEVLSAGDVTYRPIGPGHFGVGISSPYPDGRRVVWSNGREKIVKLDHETFELLSAFPIPGMTETPVAEMDAAIAQLDTLEGNDRLTLALQLAARYLTGLAGVYYVLDRDNHLYVGGAEEILEYGETDPSDPASPIVEIARWRKPEGITGEFVGANMTFDGRLVLATENGWVVVVERDLSDHEALLLPFADSDDAAGYSARKRAESGGGGNGWVRNSMATGDDGGIYVASLQHMHKIVWDGEALMNVVLYWRDGIPRDWKQLPGAPSRRIAGQLPATMGDPTRTAIQSEQSVVVSGYGALVVNNEPSSIPAGFPARALRLLVSYLGNDPAFTPHGLQKFEWDPEARGLREAWANTEVASPSTVPFVSIPANLVYTGGARGKDWTLEALDWTKGRSAFHYVLGSSRYNGFFSGVALDQSGHLILGAPFGKFRIERLP